MEIRYYKILLDSRSSDVLAWGSRYKSRANYMWLLFSCCWRSRPSVKKSRQMYLCSNYYLPLIDRSCFARPIFTCLPKSVKGLLSLLINIIFPSHMLVLTAVRSAQMPIKQSRFGHTSEYMLAERSNDYLNNRIRIMAIALRTMHTTEHEEAAFWKGLLLM